VSDKAKRRILHKIKLTEISAVDRPCQEHARMVIMKRELSDPPVTVETSSLEARIKKLNTATTSISLQKVLVGLQEAERTLYKAGFRSDQVRDEEGQWTDEDFGFNELNDEIRDDEINFDFDSIDDAGWERLSKIIDEDDGTFQGRRVLPDLSDSSWSGDSSFDRVLDKPTAKPATAAPPTRANTNYKGKLRRVAVAVGRSTVAALKVLGLLSAAGVVTFATIKAAGVIRTMKVAPSQMLKRKGLDLTGITEEQAKRVLAQLPELLSNAKAAKAVSVIRYAGRRTKMVGKVEIVRRADQLLQKFDPNQARDDWGRWSDEGGGDGPGGRFQSDFDDVFGGEAPKNSKGRFRRVVSSIARGGMTAVRIIGALATAGVLGAYVVQQSGLLRSRTPSNSSKKPEFKSNFPERQPKPTSVPSVGGKPKGSVAYPDTPWGSARAVGGLARDLYNFNRHLSKFDTSGITEEQARKLLEEIADQITEEDAAKVLAALKGKDLGKFDPDQPRADDGKWTDSGGGSSSTASGGGAKGGASKLTGKTRENFRTFLTSVGGGNPGSEEDIDKAWGYLSAKDKQYFTVGRFDRVRHVLRQTGKTAKIAVGVLGALMWGVIGLAMYAQSRQQRGLGRRGPRPANYGGPWKGPTMDLKSTSSRLMGRDLVPYRSMSKQLNLEQLSEGEAEQILMEVLSRATPQQIAEFEAALKKAA